MVETLYTLFLEPFENDFMRNAFACVILVGISNALLGCYVLLRRNVFITSALSHTILPGVVIAAFLGISLYLGALIAALFTAISVALLSTQRKINEDTAIGILLSFMFAIGVLLMANTGSFRDFTSLLFGSILGVESSDLLFALITCVAVLLFFTFFHAKLRLATFDPEYAKLSGGFPLTLQYLFLICVAFAAVSSVRIVGALLTSALLVIPAATSLVFARSTGYALKLACLFSVITGICGLYASYHFEGVPAGAAIIIAESLCFFTCWTWKKLKK